jgi:ribosomal protein S12 methylthiotransferase
MPTPNNAPTVALVSLGCPKNQVDAEVMLGLLEAAGYRLVDSPEQAEVVIVNTCAFLEPAVEEALDALLDLAELKQTGALRGLVCSGCLPQRYGDNLLTELPEVDVFLGPGAVPRIAEAVAAALAGRREVICAPLDYLCTAETPRLRAGPEWLAYLKIADGCDNRCAYCIVPDLRGPYRSRPPADLRREFAGLAGEGVREVVLIAQDSSNYGRDLRPPSSLAALLRELGQVAYEGWLRVMYLHPARLDEPLLRAMAETPAVVPYLDLPLQHAAPEVLRRMGRAGSAESYLELLAQVRTHLPTAALRTTFIVGFPGETDEDFERLLAFVQAARFDRLSAFRYWPEEGTPAAKLPEQVPIAVAEERLAALMELQEGISLENNRRLIGRRLRVLVEEVGPEEARGRSYRDAPEVDGQVRLAPVPPGVAPGQFVEAEITGAEIHDLVGRPCLAYPPG